MLKNLVIVIIAIAFYCYRSPFFHLVDPVSYSVSSFPAKLEGPLASNTKLDNAEKLHENILHGPEAFAVYNGKVYTGLADGRIVQVTKQKVIDVVRTGEPCAGPREEPICGRPLGMTFSKTGLMYVVDAYHGLFSVDVKTGKKKNILPSSTIIDGWPLTALNNLALDEKEQTIYMSQPTSRWNFTDMFYSILEHDMSGRVLKYDLKTKQVTVLDKDLPWPNGVELTHDGSSILVAMISGYNIVKYSIHGETKGTKSVLPIVLPGEPDNISRTKRGTYWVAIFNARSQENLSLQDKLADKPNLRKIILYVYKIIATPIATVMGLLPYEWAKETAFELQSARIYADYIKVHSMVIEFDDSGKILQSLQSPAGNIAHLSEAFEHNGHLYLGSFKNSFIGKLKL